MNPTLIVVMGPTAVGKTAYCVRLAQQHRTEVISADARQFYREMRIGTARPSPEERQAIPHHFIGTHSIHAPLTVGQYEKEALPLIQERFKHHNCLILTGGSGLYLKAIYEGLDPIPTDAGIRHALEVRLEIEGLQPLAAELQRCDPVYAATADLQNPRRVIRALEVWQLTGRPLSSFHQQSPKPRPFIVQKVVLHRPRPILYARIEARVEQMLRQGLLEEAQALFPYRHLKPLQTVGYQELFAHWEGQYSLEEAIERIRRNTRRYAKRQLTWFRNQTDATWIDL
ncbi:MAG: tRNA (adenosine(37)-N6)-dimethylallyltransferase MiaA [Bernardetiaceae bacterium]